MTITRPATPVNEGRATESSPTRFLSLRTADFDEIAGGFPGWDQRLTQIGGGPFRGRVVLAQVGRCQFFEAEGNRAILARGGSPPNSYAFSPIQPRNAGALWRGRMLRTGMINIRGPGESMDHRTAENYRTTGLVADAELVHHIAASLHGVDIDCILRGPVATIDPQRCIRLDRSLRAMLGRLAPGHPSQASLLPVQNALIEWLSDVLGHLLPESWKETPPLGSQRRARVVREAEDYMFIYLKRPMTLLEICEAVGVSERTLIYAFREQTGLSPKAYLKSLKLNHLRQDLKAADPRTQSVHGLARSWGFEHSGSLAADYRRLFGELPQQTLQRRKR